MKRVVLAFLLLAAALLAWVAAGPYLALRAMDRAIANRDSAALSRHVDFPALQASLRAQVEDAIARRVPADAQGSVLGGLGVEIATAMAGGAVEGLATPAGLAALMQGRDAWGRLRTLTGTDAQAAVPPARADADADAGAGADAAAGRGPTTSTSPLSGATHRFESHDRFVATARDGQGRPVTLVLTRRGLRWRLSDVRLSG